MRQVSVHVPKYKYKVLAQLEHYVFNGPLHVLHVAWQASQVLVIVLPQKLPVHERRHY